MNYYPARHPWAKMWSEWNPLGIDADFSRIRSLHANSVRIVLQAGTIGYPTPRPVMLSRLARVIALAQKHRLTVQLTLFDWWGSYADLAGSKRWACAIIGPYSGDHRLAFIELQNELDASAPHAVAWAQAMIPFLRSIGGGIPVALSAYRLDYLQTLAHATRPDFFSYHLIAGAEHSYTTLRQARRLSAPAPLYVGEEGTSTLPRDPQQGCVITACSEALQDHHFRTVAYAARLLGLPPVAPWTLNDFAPHTLTWNPPSTEYNFGLFRLDGKPKQVVASVTAYFENGSISTTFNNGFEGRAGGLPAQWGIYHGSQGHFARDTAIAHSGRASARIWDTTSDPTGGPSFFISPIDATVVPGRTYGISAWARGRNTTGESRIALAWFDGEDHFLGQIQSRTLPLGTTPWTLLTASAVAPAGAAYVQIHLKSFNNHGSVWYDDVSFH